MRSRSRSIVLLALCLLWAATGMASPTAKSNVIAVGATIHVKNLPDGQTWEGYWRETAKRKNIDPDQAGFAVVRDEETQQWLQEKAGVWDEAYSIPETFVSAPTPKASRSFSASDEASGLPPALKAAGVSGTLNLQGSGFTLPTPGLTISGTLTIPKGPHGPGGTFKIALPKMSVKSSDFIIVPLADPADKKVRYLLSFQIRVSDDGP